MYSLKKSITIACVKKGIEKKELPDRLGVTRQAVYKWEKKNQMPMPNAAYLARITGFTLSEFIALGED